MVNVRDTGIGIKIEDQDSVFKTFKNRTSIGLGLTLCREIVQKYNGEITFFSEYKQGSSFEVRLDLEEFEKGGEMLKIDETALLS